MILNSTADKSILKSPRILAEAKARAEVATEAVEEVIAVIAAMAAEEGEVSKNAAAVLMAATKNPNSKEKVEGEPRAPKLRAPAAGAAGRGSVSVNFRC